MKNKLVFALFLLVTLTAGLLASALPAQASPLRQAETTPPPPGFERPLIVVFGYSPSDDGIAPNQDFNLMLQLVNQGQRHARNVVITFTAGDLIPRGTGGVQTLAQLNAGEVKGILQPLTLSSDALGKKIASLSAAITYTDTEGMSYSESLNLAFKVSQPSYNPQPSKTPTQVNIVRPQVVIGEYNTDTDPLQPGTMFNLSLEVSNLGNATAKSVTAILGGGTIDTSSGTPGPGGVSGSSGEFTNFAPLGSSNIQALGDIAPGETRTAEMRLIVNVSINPGAYPVKFSFVYSDEKGVRMIDDQVITLLVYRLPQVEINFYRDPGMLFAGQPNMLPIQITNLSRNAVVLGNMKVEADGAMLQNNISLVGAIDPGGYFSLDTTMIPDAEGPHEIRISVSYTDDFNQSKVVTQTIPVDVQPMMDGGAMGPDGINGGGNIDGGGDMPVIDQPVTEQNFLQKVIRFFRGLLGLGSDTPDPSVPVDGGPIMEEPQVKPIVPQGKGG